MEAAAVAGVLARYARFYYITPITPSAHLEAA